MILGIVGTVALGKFQDLSEEAHTAAARATLGEFSSVAMMAVYNYKMERDADPTTVEVRPGVTLPVNAQGWAGNPFNPPDCLNLWQTLITSSEPMNLWGTVLFATPADGWEYLAVTNIGCLYFYKPDVTPPRYIIYNAAAQTIFGFNI